MNTHAQTTLTAGFEQVDKVHSPYLVERLLGQKPNLYGTAKFALVAAEICRIEAELGRPARVLDLGCSTSISREYLAQTGLKFEYCGVDYEARFDPDIVMDVRNLSAQRDRLPWTPDVIMLLDVLEHLPGKDADIASVIENCNALIPDHGAILVVIPQLYRLDRLKLGHLHYPEHQVRFTLEEWLSIIRSRTRVVKTHGIGYLSCLPYLPMLSPWYKETNRHGRLFRYLRGTVFEWPPLKPAETWLTRRLGGLGPLKGWCNSSLIVCKSGGGGGT